MASFGQFVRSWRAWRNRRHAADEEEEVNVSCAYCETSVEPTDDDPIAIGVVERWRPHDEDIDWMVFAHRRCFIDSLGPEASALSDWRPEPS